MHVSKHR
jgi:hypothetical protein